MRMCCHNIHSFARIKHIFFYLILVSQVCHEFSHKNMSITVFVEFVLALGKQIRMLEALCAQTGEIVFVKINFGVIAKSCYSAEETFVTSLWERYVM